MSTALKADVVWAKFPWQRQDYPTIMSGWVVRYTLGERAQAEISASRDMVSIGDIHIASRDRLAEVQDIIRRAWRQHLHLKQQGVKPLPEEPMT